MNDFLNPLFPGTMVPHEERRENNNLVDNLLALLKENKRRPLILYLTFKDAVEWRDVKLEGVINRVGRDYLELYNHQKEHWFVIPLRFINYIEFTEPLNYEQL